MDDKTKNKIIELRKRLKNVLHPVDDEDILLPAELNCDQSELIIWHSPVVLKDVLTETGDTALKDEDMKFLLCKINLDAPLKTILTDIELNVKYFQELKGTPRKKRLSINTIEQDIEILEKYLIHKKSVREIAQELNPIRFKRNEDSVIREVRRCVARIKKIIREGDF